MIALTFDSTLDIGRIRGRYIWLSHRICGANFAVEQRLQPLLLHAHIGLCALRAHEVAHALRVGADQLRLRAAIARPRGRAAEVMVDHADVHIIREREAITSLFALEKLLP